MARNADRDGPDGTGPTEPDLGDVTGYEDDGAFVIRDEHNPDAWLRSTTVRELGG